MENWHGAVAAPSSGVCAGGGSTLRCPLLYPTRRVDKVHRVPNALQARAATAANVRAGSPQSAQAAARQQQCHQLACPSTLQAPAPALAITITITVTVESAWQCRRRDRKWGWRRWWCGGGCCRRCWQQHQQQHARAYDNAQDHSPASLRGAVARQGGVDKRKSWCHAAAPVLCCGRSAASVSIRRWLLSRGASAPCSARWTAGFHQHCWADCSPPAAGGEGEQAQATEHSGARDQVHSLRGEPHP